eukprot:5494048-Pyramimonas_sp.AAC.1
MEEVQGPKPQFWAAQETRVSELQMINQHPGSLRARGLNADLRPAVCTGASVLSTSAGVLAGGLSHICQRTLQLDEVYAVPDTRGRTMTCRWGPVWWDYLDVCLLLPPAGGPGRRPSLDGGIG